MKYSRVAIPTSSSFLEQWHLWVYGIVSRSYRRDKDRMRDTVQNAMTRLLAKEFIDRWFYKHLTDEYVDREQAEKILGGVKVSFVGKIPCMTPDIRGTADSLWRIRDLLRYAKFDYDRYFYSIQDHTISSDRILQLLGYPPGKYDALSSLYRQGRLKPSELTEHVCTGDKFCPGCKAGKASLKSRKISLAHRWDTPEARPRIRKLRWNDSQLRPFLRQWKGQNMVFCVPEYIMRQPNHRGQVQGIDAGLLKYAKIVITNTVVNDFKRMTRTNDLQKMVFNGGISPEYSDSDNIAYQTDEGEEPVRVFRDVKSDSDFKELEVSRDINRLINKAGLTDEEREAVRSVDLFEMTVREYSEASGKSIPRIHRVRASAMKKLCGRGLDRLIDNICEDNGCSRDDLSNPVKFGPVVKARTEVFSKLHDNGMTVESIATHFDCSEDMVAQAINRMCLRDMSSTTTA